MKYNLGALSLVLWLMSLAPVNAANVNVVWTRGRFVCAALGNQGSETVREIRQ